MKGITLVFIAVVLLGFLMLSGCNAKKETTPAGKVNQTQPPANDTPPAGGNTTPAGNATTGNNTPAANDSPVTKADLDKLKEDINKIDVQDVGGLPS
ncbi:MAG: hypothetical protein V1492_01750 [Candidatus Micrarchaeota archaeon]